MGSAASVKQLDQRFKITVLPAKDQIARMQGVIARQAFLEDADFSPGHELDNWRHAKSELVKALCYGLILRDDDIWVETDTGAEFEGTVEILVSSRQVTICGKPRSSQKRKLVETGNLQEQSEIIFRVLNLPVDIEPSAVTAKLNGPMLEICLPKAHTAG